VQAQILPMDDNEKLRDALFVASMLMFNNEKEARHMCQELYQHGGKLAREYRKRHKSESAVVNKVVPLRTDI
jgi:hypothetical protein